MNNYRSNNISSPENRVPTAALSDIIVRPIQPHEAQLWDNLMDTYHYLGFRTLVGESMKYVALLNGEWVALLGWGNAAFKCGPRDKWLGWTQEQQFKRLRYIVNNQRFLILPGMHIPNLASKVLAANVRRLSADWQAVYNHHVLLAETFVDHARFAGTSYRAAGWIPLGITRGFGRNGGVYYYHGHPKTIWVKPLHKKAREWLAASFDVPELHQGGVYPMVNLNSVALETPGGLLSRLARLPDPRKRRGIRHRQISILAITICALLSGSRSLVAIAEWASDLPQSLLKRLGCRWHQEKKQYIPPSEPTIRRTLHAIDVDLVDQVVGEWLAEQADADAVAVDGKALRGSGHASGKPVHLVAALLHRDGVVINQKEVDSKSNEITAFKPLLDPLDLEGKVVTADAMHALAENARYLKEQKKADYFFTIKENQPTIFHAIQDLEPEDFSPSGLSEGQGTWPHRNPEGSNQYGAK